jgi:hypothetical protein
MTAKEVLKSRLCVRRMKPNYSLYSLVHWAKGEGITDRQMLDWLIDIHKELEEELALHETEAWKTPYSMTLKRYWCFYCEQAQAYYKAVSAHPEQEAAFWFLK